MFNDELLDSLDNIFQKYRVFLVGGYIRDFLINNKSSFDRDIVCVEKAKELAFEISEFLNGTYIELDKENEIYRIVLKDKINYIDVAKCVENDVLKDVERRDFTINSIFYDLNKKEFFDPTKGENDIKNKTIRTFKLNNLLDDPLRMLRMYRFQSVLGYKIDEELKDFTKKNFKLVNNIAKERINQEILHIFEGNNLNQTLLDMFDDGALEIIFPFIKEIKRIPPNSHHHLDLVHHSIETVNNIRINNPLLKLSALYHDIGKPATWTIEPLGRHRFISHDIKGAQIAKQELQDLKFSKKQIKYICELIKNHIYPATLINAVDSKGSKAKAFARFVKKMGDLAPDVIELSRADRLSAQGEAITDEIIKASLNHLEELLNYYYEVKKEEKNVIKFLNGNEIMEILNIKPSKTIAQILDEIKLLTISGEIQTKQDAIDFVIKKFKK